MQTTPKPISTKSPRKTKNAARFLLDWAAVIALALCFIVFTLIKGNRFMSFNNMINILRAMSITTVFAIAATVTMAPDGFDMSACTLASCSAYVFVSMYLWYGLPLFACVLITIAVTLVMYQLTMFLILVCKIPDMLATCALMFVHQGLGQWYIGGFHRHAHARRRTARAHQAGALFQRHRQRALADHHHAGLRAHRAHLPRIY